MEAGIRINRYAHVSFSLDLETGDMDVIVTLITDEGVERVVTGSVNWDE